MLCYKYFQWNNSHVPRGVIGTLFPGILCMIIVKIGYERVNLFLDLWPVFMLCFKCTGSLHAHSRCCINCFLCLAKHLISGTDSLNRSLRTVDMHCILFEKIDYSTVDKFFCLDLSLDEHFLNRWDRGCFSYVKSMGQMSWHSKWDSIVNNAYCKSPFCLLKICRFGKLVVIMIAYANLQEPILKILGPIAS